MNVQGHVSFMGEHVRTPDGYYLKSHPLVEMRTGRRDSVALIKMNPHLYVAEVIMEDDGNFIAVFLSGRENDRHVLHDTDINALVLKACAYDRLTSTTKG